HYFKVAALTRIRTGAAASSAVASRYCVVTLGLTATWKAPVAAAGVSERNCFHGPPPLRSCTTTPRRPRTTPLSLTLTPGAIAGFGAGGCSERTPMLNQVERRPNADATAAPAALDVRCVPRCSEVSLTVFTRFDELRTTVASTTCPATPSARPSTFAVTGTGPQSWYGEIVSYGSRTETRYGRPGAPNASAADCVLPP